MSISGDAMVPPLPRQIKTSEGQGAVSLGAYPVSRRPSSVPLLGRESRGTHES